MQSVAFAVLDADVEAIERATVDAVAPQFIEEIDGWLLPFDTGSIGRAKSAVPLRHGIDISVFEAIRARYAARAQPLVFRLPDVPSCEDFKRHLRAFGFSPGKPTLVQIASCERVLQVASEPLAELAPMPDSAWAALFLGEGFDPVDGASRVASLSRAKGTQFASLREGGQTLAAGAGAYGHGWASAHGMRTAQGMRGRGLAGRVLASIAQDAIRQGIGRMFLQVEEGNAAALSLYRRAGFSTAWCYEYWSKHEH